LTEKKYTPILFIIHLPSYTSSSPIKQPSQRSSMGCTSIDMDLDWVQSEVSVAKCSHHFIIVQSKLDVSNFKTVFLCINSNVEI